MMIRDRLPITSWPFLADPLDGCGGTGLTAAFLRGICTRAARTLATRYEDATVRNQEELNNEGGGFRRGVLRGNVARGDGNFRRNAKDSHDFCKKQIWSERAIFNTNRQVHR